MVSAGTVIQDAISASDGSPVKLRAGIFEITDMLNLDVPLRGAGRNKTWIKLTADAEAIIHCMRDGFVSDLTLQGPGSGHLFNYARPISGIMMDADNVKAYTDGETERVDIWDVGHAVEMRDNVWNVRFNQVHAFNIKKGYVAIPNNCGHVILPDGRSLSLTTSAVAGNNYVIVVGTVDVTIGNTIFIKSVNGFEVKTVASIPSSTRINLDSNLAYNHPANYNGANFITHDCWVNYTETEQPEYGYWIEKANAAILHLGQVMNPTVDCVYIGDFAAGVTVIDDCQFDCSRRLALNVRNPVLNGWLRITGGSFFKGGLSNASVSGVGGTLPGGGIFLRNLWKTEVADFEVESLVDTAVFGPVTQPHHVLHAKGCLAISIQGASRLYGNGDSYDYAVLLEDTTDSLIGGFFAQNVASGVVETGASNRNRITPFGSSGLNAFTSSVNLAGAQSQALYFDHLNNNRLTVKGEFVIEKDLWVLGDDIKLGANSKRPLVNAGSTLVINYGDDYSLVQLRNLENYPDETLSGTPRICKLWMGGQGYFFKIYPIAGS